MKKLLLLGFALIFITPQTSLASIKLMTYAGCGCVCHGDELATDGNLITVCDNTQQLMFHYTPDGGFAGFVGSAIKCKPAFPFRPQRIQVSNSQIHSLNMADRSYTVIGSNGEIQSKITMAEAGFGKENPVSLAVGDSYTYLCFTSGKVVACEYDLSVTFEASVKNPASMSWSEGKLYILSQNGEISIFDEELNKIETPKLWDEIGKTLKQPEDVYANESGLWIADTGNNRVVVLWHEGGWASWGGQARSFEITKISGDPILAEGKQMRPRRVLATNDFFYITTPDHEAFSIPRENLSETHFGLDRHKLDLLMTEETYSQNIEKIWALQQKCFPRTAVCVQIADESSVFIDSEHAKASVDEVLNDCDLLKCLLEEKTSEIDHPFTLKREGDTLVLTSSTDDHEMAILKIFKVSGGQKPLITELFSRKALESGESKITASIPKLSAGSIYLATIETDSGKFLTFEWFR